MMKRFPEGKELTPHNKEYRANARKYYGMIRELSARYKDKEYGRTLLTKYDDVKATVRGKELSVKAKYSQSDSYMRRVAANGLDIHEGETAYEPPLVLLDDPDHRRVRSLMSKAFTPRAIEGMRERIEEITKYLLSQIRGKKRIDLVRHFIGPLPTQVILDMMGMAHASVQDFKSWSEDILMGYDPERGKSVQKRLRSAYLQMSRVFKKEVEARRAQPGEDLISSMVRAQEKDDKLKDLEIISLCTQLMVAGNVTTSDLMANGLFALMNNPNAQNKLISDLTLIEHAVEEMLRFDCPISETARIVKSDMEVNGCPVHKGETLTASLGAANHDPAKFENPHVFDIEREANDHLGFGSGIHVCLGAPLARLEVQIALKLLLQQYPNIKLNPDNPPVRRVLPFFSGFTRLDVCLE